MTHTLHRLGSIESLQNDICVLAQLQKNVNQTNSKPKLLTLFNTAHDCGAVNMGSIVTGNMVTESFEFIIEHMQDERGGFIVFDDKENAAKFLKKVKELDLGISIVVTALWDLVKDICAKAGVAPHTVNRSLGIWGKLSLLPEERIQELISMCGHGQISAHLVRKILADIEKGRISPRDGALKLARPCVCGFFNPPRAEKLLAAMNQES